jgi:NADH-quinone oxidoreductase subunit M
MVAGIFVGTIYMLRLYQKMMFGPLDKKENQALSDLDQREMAYLAPIVIFVFWIGLYPRAFLDIMHVSVGKLAGGL